MHVVSHFTTFEHYILYTVGVLTGHHHARLHSVYKNHTKLKNDEGPVLIKS